MDIKLIVIGNFNEVCSEIERLNINENCFYIYEISQNRTKVGYSNNISGRLYYHYGNLRLYSEYENNKIAVFQCENARATEFKYKELLSRKYKSIGLEWFKASFNQVFNSIDNYDFPDKPNYNPQEIFDKFLSSIEYNKIFSSSIYNEFGKKQNIPEKVTRLTFKPLCNLYIEKGLLILAKQNHYIKIKN